MVRAGHDVWVTGGSNPFVVHAECSCGWRSNDVMYRWVAQQDGDEHLKAGS